MRLSKKLEFNEGDTGPPGGIQVKEPASANPTTADMIRRFGGSTSMEMPWPEEDSGAGDEDDRFDRLEKMIQKTLSRINQAGGHNGKGRRGAGTGSGTGSGTGQMSGSGGSEASHEDAED
mmetsp:Transcript_32865/g.59313  ORF Transcript_32865/g.59313 Transcript_32865/m.59313 type:complete len:120 (+) Transcript_32865:2-361(+)